MNRLLAALRNWYYSDEPLPPLAPRIYVSEGGGAWLVWSRDTSWPVASGYQGQAIA